MKNWSKFAFFIVAITWGSSFAFQKVILAYIDPYTLTFWNFAVAFFVLLFVALYTHTNLFYRLREGLILGFFLAALEIFQMVGLQFTSSANTAFISNLGMLLIPYAGWVFFRHRVTMWNNAALALAIIGMYLLVGGVSSFGYGDSMLLISAVAVAFYFLYSQRFEGEKSSHILALLVQQFFVTAVLSALAVFIFGHGFSVPQEIQVKFGIQIMLFTVIPYVLIQWASRWTDEMVSAIYDGVVEPLVGGITSWVIFAESATKSNVAGALLMVTAFAIGGIFSTRHFLRRGLKAFDAFVQ